jgi:hypothetical protein
MAVYVDDLMEWPRTRQWPFGLACHMVADTLEELHAMARQLRLKPEWFQASPPHRVPHYDLTAHKRSQAIACGAVDDEEAMAACTAYWRKRFRDSQR